MSAPNLNADIGVIGGTGLYELLDETEEVKVSTPYGPPSDLITVAELSSRQVAFLPRHGRDHRFPPHRIPYRANIWALRSLGVRQILAPCAVGGLRPDFIPGTFVVPDQLIDRTSGREQTFCDTGAVHTTFAEPYCPDGRRAALAATERVNRFDGGTMVVIDGPRFSTRAESRWLAAAGGTIINMTGQPEAALARELALCYTSIALVTDLDAGLEGNQGVTHDEVLRAFAENVTVLRRVLFDAVAALPVERACPCPRAFAVPVDLDAG
ncbi:S-methyl-5'-thioadenosine phosphorylase [Salinispora arenicola]|uniref:S-methyl-5'-thioadenosine phosphorylase n=1 Tax=Salinispora arenicola TaxID=168697 RepID=UPI00036611EA|nr:S-methyl-5'-thioadenosine phosphorylase [Salinispora arenicola]NIL42458.1 S-methyl-5'-thioadenosine phosphorylase [Salinispora arenicola]